MIRSPLRIGILMGGPSPEWEVSLNSGRAVWEALTHLGYSVRAFDIVEGFPELSASWEGGVSREEQASRARLTLPPPDHPLVTGEIDLVFNALHGTPGEDGTVQALLEFLRIPYTGSGVAASALAMDKIRAKARFQEVEVPTPRALVLEAGGDGAADRVATTVGFPAVVKPRAQGSTVGVTILESPEELPAAVERARAYGDFVLVEEYIPGREITVSILGEEALPVVEIHPEGGFYDYDHKYTSGLSGYTCPAELEASLAGRLQEIALTAFRALGCRDYGRVDLRLDQEGWPFCLEVNTLPGLTGTSLVPKAARAAGMDFRTLVERIVELAVTRSGDYE